MLLVAKDHFFFQFYSPKCLAQKPDNEKIDLAPPRSLLYFHYLHNIVLVELIESIMLKNSFLDIKILFHIDQVMGKVLREVHSS